MKSDAIGLLKVGGNSKIRPTERAYEACGSLEVRHKILSLFTFLFTQLVLSYQGLSLGAGPTSPFLFPGCSSGVLNIAPLPTSVKNFVG